MNAATSSVVTRCHVVWSYGGVLAAVLLGATICAAGDTAAADSADARRIEESGSLGKRVGRGHPFAPSRGEKGDDQAAAPTECHCGDGNPCS